MRTDLRSRLSVFRSSPVALCNTAIHTKRRFRSRLRSGSTVLLTDTMDRHHDRSAERIAILLRSCAIGHGRPQTTSHAEPPLWHLAM